MKQKCANIIVLVYAKYMHRILKFYEIQLNSYHVTYIILSCIISNPKNVNLVIK